MINEYLQALDAKEPELKEKVKNSRFWRQLLFDHLNWKYRDADKCHRAIYEFLGLKSSEKWIVAFHFQKLLPFTFNSGPFEYETVLKYPDNNEKWKYTTKDKAFRFVSQESAQDFIDSLDPIHKPIARIEKC